MQKTDVLLIEDDSTEHLWVKEQLKENAPAFNLIWMDTVQKGIDHITAHGADVVLLDLHLPDSTGLETFYRFHPHAHKSPVIILTGMDDDESGLEAVRKGAQDYLVKGDVDGKRLARVIRYALQRHDRQAELQSSKLTDTFTGLYNRQGFLVMAERHLKTAKRTEQGFFLTCIVFNLKDISAQQGQGESDAAVGTIARILEESFRTSDIIARIGLDQFVVITSEADANTPRLIKSRLQKNQTYYNSQFNHYKLALSICTAVVDPKLIKTPEQLAKKMDQLFAQSSQRNN